MPEKEYIERSKTIDAIREYADRKFCNGEITLVNGILKAIGVINEMSAADVAEVKHGEWILKSKINKMADDVDEEFYVECPFCHRTEYVPFEFEEEKMLEYARTEYPYCHCGAKMDGGKNV